MHRRTRVVQITSPKHPGAVFIGLRRFGQREVDFICKVYPEHADLVSAELAAALDRLYHGVELSALYSEELGTEVRVTAKEGTRIVGADGIVRDVEGTEVGRLPGATG